MVRVPASTPLPPFSNCGVCVAAWLNVLCVCRVYSTVSDLAICDTRVTRTHSNQTVCSYEQQCVRVTAWLNVGAVCLSHLAQFLAADFSLPLHFVAVT